MSAVNFVVCAVIAEWVPADERGGFGAFFGGWLSAGDAGCVGVFRAGFG